MPRPVSTAIPPKAPSIDECKDCRGLEKIRAMSKDRKNINATIRRHQYEVHGIPYPQQQQHHQPSKKPKKSKPSSDEESDDGLIDGFFF